jgi:hypothetical protein
MGLLTNLSGRFEYKKIKKVVIMNGKKLKELISRIPDDAEVVHLWNGGFAWREGGGNLHAYSFKPDFIIVK